jgi:hypothetical protein
MLWDHLFGQKLCKPVPLTSEIQGDVKMERTIFQQKIATNERRNSVQKINQQR